MSTDLVPTERKRLKELEGVVQRSIKAFVDVGQALQEIRDSRLYRQTHKTFEDYLEDRWGMKRRTGYAYIAGASVALNVPTSAQIPLSKSVELARLEPEEQRRIVVEAPVEDLTVAEVRREVRKVVQGREPDQLKALVDAHNVTSMKIEALWEKQHETELRLAPLLYEWAKAEKLTGHALGHLRTDYKKVREGTGLKASADSIKWMIGYAYQEEARKSLDEIARTMPDGEWDAYMENFCTTTPEGERTKQYLLEARAKNGSGENG